MTAGAFLKSEPHQACRLGLLSLQVKGGLAAEPPGWAFVRPHGSLAFSFTASPSIRNQCNRPAGGQICDPKNSPLRATHPRLCTCCSSTRNAQPCLSNLCGRFRFRGTHTRRVSLGVVCKYVPPLCSRHPPGICELGGTYTHTPRSLLKEALGL